MTKPFAYCVLSEASSRPVRCTGIPIGLDENITEITVDGDTVYMIGKPRAMNKICKFLQEQIEPPPSQ